MRAAFWFLAFLSSAATAGVALDERLNKLCIEKPEERCLDVIERFQLLNHPKRLSRNGDHLAVHLPGGRRIDLKDTKPERVDAIVLYRYVQYVPSIGFHLIWVQYYEGNEYLLVSNADGSRHFIPDLPRVSPDRLHFVVASASEAYNFNGVMVYRVVPGGVLRTRFWYEARGDDLISFNKWNNSESIALTKVTRADEKRCAGHFLMRVPLTLQRDKTGRWDLNEDTMSVSCGE
jgi:hypothetical protein